MPKKIPIQTRWVILGTYWKSKYPLNTICEVHDISKRYFYKLFNTFNETGDVLTTQEKNKQKNKTRNVLDNYSQFLIQFQLELDSTSTLREYQQRLHINGIYTGLSTIHDYLKSNLMTYKRVSKV